MFSVHGEVECLFLFHPGDAKRQWAAFGLLPSQAPPDCCHASNVVTFRCYGLHHWKIAHSSGLMQSLFQVQAARRPSGALESHGLQTLEAARNAPCDMAEVRQMPTIHRRFPGVSTSTPKENRTFGERSRKCLK